MTPRQGLFALFGLIGTPLIVFQPSPVEAAQGDLQLVAQNFNVAADGSLIATVALPPDLANTDLSTNAIVVTVSRRVDKREDLSQVINGTFTPPDDTVTFPPGCCAGPQPGQFTVSVPLEAAEVRPDALSIPRAGLYGATIALERDGTVITSVQTFLNRLPAADESTEADTLSVAVAIGTHSTVHLDSKATTSLDDTAVAEMTALADSLDALNANKFPATVRLTPEVLNGLQLHPDLFARLVASLQVDQVVAEPRWPIDPSSAAVAEQDQLYTTWLRDGEERFAGLGLGPAIITRSTIFADQPIGAEGATLRRNLGAGLIVMSPRIYDDLDGTIGAYSDYTGELVAAELPNNTALDIAVVDHAISQLLVSPLPTLELTRIYVVANLLALRQKIQIDGANLLRHAVVIGTPDLGVPDAALLGSITALIAETPGLAAATLDDVTLRTDRLLVNGEERPVTLPSGNGDDLKKRIFIQASLSNEIDAVASMLPDDSDKPKGWRDLTALLPTTALDDPAAEGMASAIDTELAAIRDAVQLPAAYTINLPGRRSTVRIRFVNNSDVPLKIKVRLSSPSGKLVFTNDDQPIELLPGVPRNIPIDVEARSNGTSQVFLDVFTPNDVSLGPTTPLEFRVNALGVGNVLTGVLFALVLLWWLQHIRSKRKKRRESRRATLNAS